ncbi:hypothetical protein LAG90_07915 [Marinilongibacter aquaticus]|uniref:hypothetical protein n=1 Tax=Marinilongibacter aquaticus TaxID=2975157 RepID=UPI0021BD53A8|nr:hypothetical protein [Marinilongibacter aquaticus]UBM60566.1 hypothetical protein LAG90_07915 [Marinilongibacter aquaticus]
MKASLLGLCIFLSVFAKAQNPLDALLPLEEGDRDGATIMTYDKGTLKVFRKGTNALICLADDPEKEGFHVACYHKDLEPLMARGRELRAMGKDNKEINSIREAEAKSGKLKMPETARTLYVLSGKDKESANLRWVVYVPWATAESTGLPTKPLVPGGPWIMFPGTYRAHIMITPVN